MSEQNDTSREDAQDFDVRYAEVCRRIKHQGWVALVLLGLLLGGIVAFCLWNGRILSRCADACEKKGCGIFTVNSWGAECQCAPETEWTPLEGIPTKETP